MVDDERGTLKFEFNRHAVFLHLVLRKPMEGMRVAHTEFQHLKKLLRNIGYRFVHVIIPDGDQNLYRFEQSFGFCERKRAGGQILMRQEC